ncbi:hypothetical protein A2U01_0085072, partial [Trifolium medium]|nr:hypothetical protein [Trifolium medium]
CKKGSIE